MCDKEWVERQYARLLVGIIVLAVLAIAASFWFEGNRLPFTLNGETWAIATNLVNGQGYTGCSADYFPFCNQTTKATAMREPVPVLLMAAAMLIYPSQYSGMAMQGLLYLGTALVVSAILKGSDRRLSLLAALLWVISVPVVREILVDNGELAAAFFLSTGIWSFQQGRRNPRGRYWILSGVLLGMASLSRTVLLGVSIGLGFGLLFEQWRTMSHSWKQRLAPVSLFFVSLSLAVIPWVVRNFVVFGVPVLGSTLTGYNVYRMNFIIADSDFYPHYVGNVEGARALTNLIQHSHLSGTENEAQMQALYMEAGVQTILRHPFQYLYLSIYRFLPLWFNLSVKAAYGRKLIHTDYVMVIQQTILLVAVILGSIQNRKNNWPFVVSLILGCGAYLAVGAQLRYLVDLMPVIVIIAASAFPIRDSCQPRNPYNTPEVRIGERDTY